MVKHSLLPMRNYMQYVLYPRRKCNINTQKYSTTTEHYDIVINGGGMVGTTVACTLGKNTKLDGRRILLLESNKPTSWHFKEQYSNRVSALNSSTYTLLNQIGAWKHIADVRSAPVNNLQVWDAVSDAAISFSHDDSLNVVAHIVENDVLLHAVGKELSALENVTTMNEVKVKEYSLPKNDKEVVTVNLEDGKCFTCNLLLGCDGVSSQVRTAMGVKWISWNYNQRGIVATLQLSEDGKNVTAWQRFLPTGPIAILPLSNNLSSLVWTTTLDSADHLLGLTEEQFVDKVNKALWEVQPRNTIVQETTKGFNKFLEYFQLPTSNEKQRPPNIIGVEQGSRAAFPLGFGHATNYVNNKVALVGDAAHRIHPLAGQGVNLGFGDVSTLNDVLGEAVYSGRKLGLLSDLQEYETRRQRHNFPTMLAIDGLQKIYNTDFPPIVLLRSLGLQLTNALSPIKTAFIDHAGK